MKDISIGLSGYGRALGFAFRNGLWWMFLVPLALWLLFAGGLLWLSTEAVDLVRGYTDTYLGITIPAEDRSGLVGFWDDVKGFFDSARDVIVLVIVKVALWFLFGLVGKYVVLITLSPLMAYASERTEEILTGRTFPFRWGLFVRDVGRGILMALRNGFLELGITVIVWVGTLFVSPLAPLSALFLWLVSCWFYGFSMFDYVFERRRMGIGASARAARERRGMVMANGAVFSLLMNIPVLGLITGVVFAPILGSIGAVLSWYEAHPIAPDGTTDVIPH